MFVISGNLDVPVRRLVTVIQRVPLKTSPLARQKKSGRFLSEIFCVMKEIYVTELNIGFSLVLRVVLRIAAEVYQP